MWKTVLAGTTALAIAGATFAYAQSGPMQRDRVQRWHPSAADIAAFQDARIAALHAGLQLTSDQEKNWPAVESALKELGKERQQRFAARASADKPTTPVERWATRAQNLTARGAALKKLADAAAPLYASLTPDQKQRFGVLAKLGGGNSAHGRGHGGGRGQDGDWHHRGPRGQQSGATPQ